MIEPTPQQVIDRLQVTIVSMGKRINELETELGRTREELERLHEADRHKTAEYNILVTENRSLAARLKQAEAVIVAAQAVVDHWDYYNNKSMKGMVLEIDKLRDILAQSES